MAETNKFLSSAGLSVLWKKIKSTFVAQQSGFGLYPDADKTKLSTVQEGANNFTLEPATSGKLGGVKIGTGLNVDDGTISVQQISYDSISGTPDLSGYQTASQVEQIVTGKGYQTADEVTAIATGQGYQTASQVTAIVEGKGYQTANDVSGAISSAIADIDHLKRVVLGEEADLPVVGSADVNTIYMKKKATTDNESDVYTEHMVINGKWEQIGDTTVDLSEYLKTADLASYGYITADQIEAIPDSEINALS